MSTNKQATVRIALGTWDRLRDDAYSVRHEVFVVEQKVPPEVELDDAQERTRTSTPEGTWT